jgi:hypothetical protein
MLRDMQWLKNEEGFGSESKGPSLASIFQAAQRKLLSLDESKMPIMELQPPEKQQALVFYVQSYSGFIPNVKEDNWISLGFCTAVNCESEQQLASAYRSLIARCSFDEFWNAMVESKMTKLFRKYRLTNQISQLRNFEDFMNIVKKWHQSVWELKRFTRMNVADPFRAVVVDYGFMNCEDARQRMQLRAVYHEYFGRGEDEIRLHEACISGKLASFLESVLGSVEVRRDLFQNPYPLENCPLMGMVTESVLVQTQSVSDRFSAVQEGDRKEVMIVPDSVDKKLSRWLHNRAAFLGIGLKKRYFSGPDGRGVVELAL